MRVIGLKLLFVGGAVVGISISWFIFFRSLFRGARAFHPQGSVCTAEITAIDDHVIGKRLAGPARVRLSGVGEPENSPNQTVIGLAVDVADGAQNLLTATFEAFLKTGEGTRNTDVTDYLGKNQYASVAPWRVDGAGVMWLRIIPHADAQVAKSGSRTERLDADIAAGRAKLVLELRTAPNADGPLHAAIATITLAKREPADDPKFRMSMWRTGRGFNPTGFRNGVRAIVYGVSQFARGLRGD